MNQQWPKEKHAENQEDYTDPAFKTAQDFLDLLDLVPDVLPEAFNDVVSWIVAQGGDLSELEKHSVSVEQSCGAVMAFMLVFNLRVLEKPNN